MNEPTQNKEPQSHGAHSAFKRGISDYNDGANVTDQLGNDDQETDVGIFESGAVPSDSEAGHEALGNELSEDEED